MDTIDMYEHWKTLDEMKSKLEIVFSSSGALSIHLTWCDFNFRRRAFIWKRDL